MRRKEQFVSGEIYHLCNKSIANFGIFRELVIGQKFIEILDYYNNRLVLTSFSQFLKKNKHYDYQNLLYPKEFPYVKFLGYNIMPDHYHLLIKILHDRSLSQYIANVENSFTRYFNIRFKRKGPLWQSCFKAVRIKTNEQLLHVSRYIHLNPTSAGLVNKPEDWPLSSYRDFINNEKILKEIITEISIRTPSMYKKFVEDQKNYQRKLKLIKKLILE